MVGNNLQELVSQVEKASLYVGSRPVITLDDLRAIVSQSKVFSAFELARYMGEKIWPGLWPPCRPCCKAKMRPR